MPQCTPFEVDFCKELPYNYTIFPNGLGHVSLEETNYVLESFKWVYYASILLYFFYNYEYLFLDNWPFWTTIALYTEKFSTNQCSLVLNKHVDQINV